MFNSSPRLKKRQISRAHTGSIPVVIIALHQERYLWTPSNGRWHFAAWIPDQYFPIPMAWVRKFWVPTGDENHVTNVAPWILRWTPAQKFLAFYFSLGGNLDKNNVRSFFCHVNAAVRVHPIFVDQVGHKTMYSFSGNKHLSLNFVIVRLTKIMNRADKNWLQF